MAKRVHFLGIGGSGTSAAAAIAQAQGFEVTGCDLNPHNEFTTIFQPNQLLIGHSPQHLYCHPERLAKDLKIKESKDSSSKTPQNDKAVDILAVTPAIFSLDPDNSELREAKKEGIEVLTWQQFVGKYLAKDKFVIAVCGTHGKTTTTAMIAQILEDAEEDPTVELGGIIPRWKTNFRIGKGKYMVVEADEFNDNFLSHFPQITVVTNIEMDHPEYFKDFEEVKSSFKKFLLQTKGSVIANLTDSNIAEVLKDVMKESKVSAVDFTKSQMEFELKVPGQHNILNAKAAMQVGLILGIDSELIRKSLNNYQGAGRRFEYLGEFNPSTSSGQVGAKIYSDFAHHPTEIAKTMEAARQKFPNNRILLIYQPHMFSRTKALFEDFVKVFQKLPVDKTFIVDIYPSREKDTGLVTSKQLVTAINKLSVSHPGGFQRNGSLNDSQVTNVLEKIKPEIKKGDIVFFMGAGSIDQLARGLIDKEKYCTIYIVRHGQTDWNAQKLIQGQSDIPLNAVGIKQAQSLGQDLKDIKFDAVFSSDLVRSKKTAEIIALNRKLAIETSKLLRERRYGRFEGKPREEMNEAHKIWADLDRQQRLTFRPDDKYETDGEIVSRLITFLREVAASHLEQTILVVAHGGLMRALLHHLSDKTYPVRAIGNSGYIKLESDGVDFFIKELKGIKNPNE